MDFFDGEDETTQQCELVGGREAAFTRAGEGQFVSHAPTRASSRGGGLRLARQLYPQRAKQVSSMYQELCRSTGKNHRGVRRRAYIAACVLHVSVKENSAYLPATFRELLDKANLTATQLLRAIQSTMTMGVRWSVPVDFNSVVAQPALEHGYEVIGHMDLPESGKPQETAAAFSLCTSASVRDAADLFGVEVQQVNRALSKLRAVEPNGSGEATGSDEPRQVRPRVEAKGISERKKKKTAPFQCLSFDVPKRRHVRSVRGGHRNRPRRRTRLLDVSCL